MQTFYQLYPNTNVPTILFSNSLGSDFHIWDELVPYLSPHFQILLYDTRGLGKSEVTPGPYSIQLLATDIIQLLNRLAIDKIAFCGLSMGGLIGQYLALHFPDRLTHLILSNTAAKIGDHNRWDERIRVVQNAGLESLADEMMTRWFSETFRSNRPNRVQEIKTAFLASNPDGYIQNCIAIREADFRNEIADIKIPSLVITGDGDPVTPVGDAQFLVDQIPEAQLVVLSACHLAPTELPKEYSNLLIDFIGRR
jgi:3-oxoadipate enol-lactonase / 4-carboxymuconolactone decarboxylase